MATAGESFPSRHLQLSILPRMTFNYASYWSVSFRVLGKKLEQTMTNNQQLTVTSKNQAVTNQPPMEQFWCVDGTRAQVSEFGLADQPDIHHD